MTDWSTCQSLHELSECPGEGQWLICCAVLWAESIVKKATADIFLETERAFFAKHRETHGHSWMFHWHIHQNNKSNYRHEQT